MKLGWNEKAYVYRHRVLVALIEKNTVDSFNVLFIREDAFDTFPTARYCVIIGKRAEGVYLLSILFSKIGQKFPYVHAFQSEISLHLEKMRLFRNHLFSGIPPLIISQLLFPSFRVDNFLFISATLAIILLAHSILPECRISSQFRSHSHRAASRRNATISCSWSAVDIAQLFMNRL